MKEIRIETKRELEGRFYIELSPGRYRGNHWRDESIYLDDEVFGLLEIPIAHHVINYDHYGVNEVSRESWLHIIGELELLSRELPTITGMDHLYGKIAFTGADSRDFFQLHFEECKEQLRLAIADLIEWLHRQLRNHDHIAILGL